MSWLQDIGINVCSDFIVIGLLALLLWMLHRKELAEARQFFGLDRQAQIRICVSGHEHKETVTKKVVTALEYEAAVEMKDALRQITGGEFVRKAKIFIAGLIGQDPQIPEPIIEVSPLDEVEESPYLDSLVLIGGPVRNQLTKLYSKAGPLLKFDPVNEKYLEWVGEQYQEIDDFGSVAILVKMIVNGQVVIAAFGTGERHTKGAVQYLIGNWRELNEKYLDQAFGILLSVDGEGKAKVQKSLPE